MRIFNIMMSRKRGGIEQAYCDYSYALTLQGYKVTNISSINSQIHKNWDCITSIKLPNLGPWCILSKLLLKILIIVYRPHIIICHGNRAITFATHLSWIKQIFHYPLIVGVAHNYSFKYLRRCDYIITLTARLRNHLLNNKIPAEHLLKLPNMLRITQQYKALPFHKPVVIGTLGRFVTKKGFNYLIEAIQIFKVQKQQEIKLIIGGAGPEYHSTQRLVMNLGLEDIIIFYGWVEDKKKFFDQIDIFCLPSIEEPFGIAILEAMEYSKPIVATKSGGPEEIIQDQKEGLLCSPASAQDLAQALIQLVQNERFAHILAYNAYLKLQNTYDINIISDKLSLLLKQITNKNLNDI